MTHGGTRLGGGAVNPAHHHSASSAEAEYDRLRDLAHQEAAKRSSCFDRAHQAYTRGDGAAAHDLSEEGHRHAAQMDQYNKQASDYIFRENNAPDRVDGDTIDLHGQYVEEAENIIRARITSAKSSGQNHLHVIVGKGNHSVDHIQKIKPAVENICREMGLNFKTEENAGRIYVDLTGGQVGAIPPSHGQPSHGQPSHGGQGQHQQQHQPPPQHGMNINQADVKKGLKLLKMLKGCCTVM